MSSILASETKKLTTPEQCCIIENNADVAQ